MNNQTLFITPGKTSVEEIIGKICVDINRNLAIFGALILVLILVHDIMQFYRHRKTKKDPDWAMQHPRFMSWESRLQDYIMNFSGVLCLYLITITLFRLYS